jgi:hypothetical protein
MALTPPGTVRVSVGNRPTATSIQYGVKTLKGSSDLDMSAAADGDVIVYKADSNSFKVEPIYDIHLTLDNGFF